ncbi:MAG: ABC transporter ATP-binding protein [Solibacillus sp.]
MIQMTNVKKCYQDVAVLEQLTFHLEKGQFAFLKGRSGSGKSTLLKLLYREIECDAGEILIDGRSILSIPKFELRRKIGIIFQSFELIEQKTVLENVLLAGKALGHPMNQIQQEAERLLKRVGLEHKKDAFPAQLSGGQQQRVAIVRALLNKPRLIIADEPTGNLDQQTTKEIMDLLYELHNEEQITMLIVTHDERLIQKGACIWEMEGGNIHEQTSN